MSDKNILFISYDGMTDSLGQSQVIPYLAGLVKEGYNITLLSCDKKDALAKHQDEIVELTRSYGIDWWYCDYKNNFPIFSPLLNYFSLKRKATQLHRKKKFSMIHGRSDIPTLVALAMKRRYGIKYIFDMRGFWADEKLDAGILNLKNPVYHFVYKFLKRKETELVSN